jgi:hypothetical protein
MPRIEVRVPPALFCEAMGGFLVIVCRCLVEKELRRR